MLNTDSVNVLQQKKVLENIKEDMVKTQKSIIDESGLNEAKFDECLSKMTKEQIENITYEEASKLFVNENGEFIFDSKTPHDMVCDFIKHLYVSKETFANVEREIENYEKVLENYRDEIDLITRESGSFNATLRNSIEAEINNPDLPYDKRQRAEQMLSGIKAAASLEPLFKLYERISKENTYRDFTSSNRYTETLIAYKKTCDKHKITPHILKLGDIQTKVLDEKYHAEENLFIFILARYIKYSDRYMKDVYTRTFIVQLMNYLRELSLPDDHEQVQSDKEVLTELKSNMSKFLDMFI